MHITRKDSLKLRKMGSKYMIVCTDEQSVNMSDVFTLNETAALLWEKAVEKEEFGDELADVLVETYGIDRELALTDTRKTFEVWKEFGLIAD